MKTNLKFFISTTILALTASLPALGGAQSLEEQLLGPDAPSILYDLPDGGAVAMTNFDKAMAQGQSIRGLETPTMTTNRSAQAVRQNEQAYQQYLRLLNRVARQ